MDIFTEELNKELKRISDSLNANKSINDEDLKIILLNLLNEEDLHENK